VRRILVIGIGAGDPRHLTLEAVEAIGRTDVFFVIDKGAAPELIALREQVLRGHAAAGHRLVVITDAERDRDPDDYERAVRDWHQERADRIGAAIERELDDDGVGAFLVWGDPALYDSTLRVLDRVRTDGTVSFAVDVVPGISAAQALAAAHGVALHGIGEPVLVTTGRRLAESFGPDVPNAVVFLDGQLAFTEIDPAGVEVLWGAYLGTPDELLVAGPLADVADRIVAERAAARDRLGWIMDIYLLRRSGGGSGTGPAPVT
jgi:precorrin-6A synthase